MTKEEYYQRFEAMEERQKKIEKMLSEVLREREWKPPSQAEFTRFFTTEGYTKESSITAYNFYNDNDWHDSNRRPIRNWKQKARKVWFKEENKLKNQPITTKLKLHQGVKPLA